MWRRHWSNGDKPVFHQCSDLCDDGVSGWDYGSTGGIAVGSPSPTVGSSKTSVFNSPTGSAVSSSSAQRRSTSKSSGSGGKKKKIPKLVINNTTTGSSAVKARPASDFEDITSSFTATTNTMTSALKSCLSSMKPPRDAAVSSVAFSPSDIKKTVVFGSPDAAEHPMLQSDCKTVCERDSFLGID